MNKKITVVLIISLSLLLSACTGNGGAPVSDEPVSSGGEAPPTAAGVEKSPPPRPPTPTPAPPRPTPTGVQLSGPSLINTALPESLPFNVILSGAPADGGPQPLFIALFSGRPYELPAGLPQEVQFALHDALTEVKDGLILLLYAGEMPSGGFSVQIETIAAQQKDGREILLVRYYIQPPDPQSGSITVLTYPYLLVHLPGDYTPEQVIFERVIP